MRGKLRDQKWYPYTVAACIAVAVYVALTHLTTVFDVVATFLGFFSAPLLGCVIAYLLNPLAMFFHRTVFRGMRKPNLRWLSSIVLAVLALVLFLGLILSTLIPQLVESITMLASNMDGYIAALVQLSHTWGIAEYINLDEFMGTSGNLMSRLLEIAGDNMQDILNVSVTAGKSLMLWGLAFMLSVYLLASKESLKSGAKRFLRALLPEKRYQVAMGFLTRCNGILQRYIVFSILDAIIIGGANAVFMACTSMQYVGLISLVVAVTNLIPTFGPVIGAVIGGFILLLVNPLHALIFVAFSVILQTLDGYVIKPKLFGNSLGVSGLLILVSVIVCGNMWGIVGILLAIPLAAIIDFICRDVVMPHLEEHRHKLDSEATVQ
ncbi:MAG: AI-2E family transporter [Atopobiaceae bacterium]|nr:AI-2E family transporter [Atopobiaceae bacterium]